MLTMMPLWEGVMCWL